MFKKDVRDTWIL